MHGPSPDRPQPSRPHRSRARYGSSTGALQSGGDRTRHLTQEEANRPRTSIPCPGERPQWRGIRAAAASGPREGRGGALSPPRPTVARQRRAAPSALASPGAAQGGTHTPRVGSPKVLRPLPCYGLAVGPLFHRAVRLYSSSVARPFVRTASVKEIIAVFARATENPTLYDEHNRRSPRDSVCWCRARRCPVRSAVSWKNRTDLRRTLCQRQNKKIHLP